MASIKLPRYSGTVAALVSVSVVAISIAAMAGPQSRSPFARKTPKAWETQTPQTANQAPASATPAQQTTPQSQTLAGGSWPAGSGAGTQISGPTVTGPQVRGPQVRGPQVRGPQVRGPQVKAPEVNGPNVRFPQVNSPQIPAWANKTFTQSRKEWAQQYGAQAGQYRQQTPLNPQTSSPSTAPGTDSTPPWARQGLHGQYTRQQSHGRTQQGYMQGQYSANANNSAYQQRSAPPPGLRGASKPSWLNRLGFGNVETSLSGHARAGVAGVARKDADNTAESIVDLDARFEASAITEGGLEYGLGLRARAQRDRHRRGFGGRVGDCPATDPACASVVVAGNTRPVKGHTSQFYTGGPDDRRETEIALEGAYVFLRSGYGDVVLGRDDGAASLFSLGAPSLVTVNASNSPVDYTGLDSVKTWNDASGFSEKISYTSPRLLGDQIGIGVQFGLSYAPNARACGVDYCVKKNATGVNEPFAPEIKNVFEGGLSIDRTFANGLRAELTGTYAHGSEDSGVPGFASLNSYGVGLDLSYADFVFGTSFLKSNNGFAGQGDYTAWDAGLTWKPNNWGFTASYGHADDDIARLTSNQAVLALSYDLGQIRLGTGVQYISRDVPIITATGRNARNEKATAVFVEVGTDF